MNTFEVAPACSAYLVDWSYYAWIQWHWNLLIYTADSLSTQQLVGIKGVLINLTIGLQGRRICAGSVGNSKSRWVRFRFAGTIMSFLFLPTFTASITSAATSVRSFPFFSNFLDYFIRQRVFFWQFGTIVSLQRNSGTSRTIIRSPGRSVVIFGWIGDTVSRFTWFCARNNWLQAFQTRQKPMMQLFSWDALESAKLT